MQFPHWADAPNLSKKRRASMRLRYLISTLALQATQRTSHRALAAKVGIDHSTISKAVRDGGFSHYSAALIENTLGRQHVRAEWLTDPLSISSK